MPHVNASAYPVSDEEGADACEQRVLHVDEAAHGRRLDQFLAQAVGEFSRSYLQQLIQDGAVQHLHGRVLGKPSARVRAGDVITLRMRPPEHVQAFVPECIPLDVLHEDAHLLVLHKPAGMVVHPAPGNWTGTLLNALLYHYPASVQIPRAGIVHRLDKDTSGLMVVARSQASAQALIGQISARMVRREYWALAHGYWQGSQPCPQLASGGSDTFPDAHVPVCAAIGRDAHNRLRMAVVDMQQQPGKPARTDFALVANSSPSPPHTGRPMADADRPPICWVQARLHTGRTHQIRVHMRHLGHPLLGDATYGGAPGWGMHRQALHAFRLCLAHPHDGRPLRFEIPLPADMQQAIDQMLGADLPAPPPTSQPFR